MRTNTAPIRCSYGKNIYTKAERSAVEISCRNIIAGLMVGSSLLVSAVIAYACM